MTTERQTLTARLTKLAEREGLKIKDAEGLTDACISGGISEYFHSVENDDSIADRIRIVHSKAPDLFEQPATSPAPLHSAGLSPAFRAFIGAINWDTAPALTRMRLWDRFCAATGTKARSSTAKPAAAAYTRPILVDLQREASRMTAELGRLREDRSGGMREQAMRAQRISNLESRLAVLTDRGAAA